MQPVLFLSHGIEDSFLKNTAFNYFMHKLSEKLCLRKPDIIICLNSFWDSEDLIIGTNLKKEIIYQENFLSNKKISYSAPNAIIFSKKLEFYLKSHGIPVKLENKAFDFGVWGTLSTLFPEADIPVVQLSIPKKDDLHYYHHLGKLLQNFSKKNVLIIVSGGLVLNMKHHIEIVHKENHENSVHIEPFSSWVNNCLIENNLNELFDYKRKGPFIEELLDFNDLTHFNSLFISIGATHPSGLKRLHFSIDKDISYECFISKSIVNQ